MLRRDTYYTHRYRDWFINTCIEYRLNGSVEVAEIVPPSGGAATPCASFEHAKRVIDRKLKVTK